MKEAVIKIAYVKMPFFIVGRRLCRCKRNNDLFRAATRKYTTVGQK